MYTIIDIETTGNGIKGNKITEISIFKYDGYEIIDEYTSLVNPECEIPYFITGLTGIDNDLVRNAPTWEEIASKATVILFKKLLRTDGAEKVFKSFLNARSQEATLPPQLPKEIFERLPNSPGVYYFKDAKGAIIYVGKAIDIKKRVLGHFYDKANKEVLMCKATHDIDFELSGNELIALLMESAAIKQHFPLYNQSQKRTSTEYAIFSYEDRNGIQQIKIDAQPHIHF